MKIDIHPFLLSRKNCCLRSDLEIGFLLINKLYLLHRIAAIVYGLPFFWVFIESWTRNLSRFEKLKLKLTFSPKTGAKSTAAKFIKHEGFGMKKGHRCNRRPFIVVVPRRGVEFHFAVFLLMLALALNNL